MAISSTVYQGKAKSLLRANLRSGSIFVSLCKKHSGTWFIVLTEHDRNNVTLLISQIYFREMFCPQQMAVML